MTESEKPEFPYPVIELDSVSYGEHLTKVVNLIKEKTGKGLGISRHTDYRRWAHLLNLVKGSDTVMDCGVGGGQFVNALAFSNSVNRIVGVDIETHSTFRRFTDDFELVLSDVSSFEVFRDNEFENTICMEVIEHLPNGIMEKGIEQLRRVTHGKLYMSVPFEEPEPIYHGHYQRYTQERLEKLFPNAEIALMYSRKAAAVSPGYCPIALIIESF